MNRSRITCVDTRSKSSKLFNLKYLAILILALAGLPFLDTAQEATIVGTITDPSGAAVPNVTVTITNVETGRINTATSNDAGLFVTPGLPIGKYDVKAEAATAGFKVEETKGIVLNVKDRVLVGFQIKLGPTAGTVSVVYSPI